MQETVQHELAKDISMSFPEDIWSLNPIERYLRTHIASEFATLDESRYFIRTILPVPLNDENDEFLWGVWCEVSREDHDRYIQAYATGSLGELGILQGRLANDLPVYEGALGLEVQLQCSQQERPRVEVLGASLLKEEQLSGINLARHQEIDFLLFGDDEEDEEFEE